MSPRVTYLLGAGASALRIPALAGLPDRIRRIASILGHETLEFHSDDFFILNDGNKTSLSKREIVMKLIVDLNWLADNGSGSSTVDTFARKLYLANQYNELERVKQALTAYFALEQLKIKAVPESPFERIIASERPVGTDNHYDPRYEPFLASLLQADNRDFPKNVTILSWNYDSQLEMAYAGFLDPLGNQKDLSIEEAQRTMRVIAKNNHRGHPHPTLSDFGVIKLNGTASFSNFPRSIYFVSNTFAQMERSIIERVLEGYYHVTTRSDLATCLSFAWENDFTNFPIWQKVPEYVADTEVLVVIGYSFPFFNRQKDRQLMGKDTMKKLQKVYFQDINPLVPLQRFESIRPDMKGDHLEPYGEVEQFFLPPQL